ncbi:hypothetical protein AB0I91_11180 [Actinosynnema sp. NPDC049800]
MAWTGWAVVPGNQPNGAGNNALAAVDHFNKVYLFAVDGVAKQAHWTRSGDAGLSWDAWQPVAAGQQVVSLSAVSWEDGLHLFGMTPNFSIYSNTRWQGTFPTWSFVPGTQNSGRPCAVDFPQGGLTTDHLYVFFTAALDGSIGWLRATGKGGNGSPTSWTVPKFLSAPGKSDQQVAAFRPGLGDELSLVRRGEDSQLYHMPHFIVNGTVDNSAPWSAIQPALLSKRAPAVPRGKSLAFAADLADNLRCKSTASGGDWTLVSGAVKTNGLAVTDYATGNGTGIMAFTRHPDGKVYFTRRADA